MEFIFKEINKIEFIYKNLKMNSTFFKMINFHIQKIIEQIFFLILILQSYIQQMLNYLY